MLNGTITPVIWNVVTLFIVLTLHILQGLIVFIANFCLIFVGCFVLVFSPWHNGTIMWWILHSLTCEPWRDLYPLHFTSVSSAGWCHGL